jgi:hypothetical protein
MNPKEKCFPIHTRNMSSRSWNSVINELKKCCLLCCRCHRELECNIISKEIIDEIYKEKWKHITIGEL